MLEHNVQSGDIYVDNFGEGANVGQEIAVATKGQVAVIPVNVGMLPLDERYLNLRAEAYWRLREWLRGHGELLEGKGWEELLTIRYRAELNGKLRMMSKKDMRSEGYKSPNIADALMLTFVTPDFDLYTTDNNSDRMTDEERYSAVGLI